ncbi:oxidoreductase [Pullulanibacillus camelliae]|uniref:Oxidoreductase n=1 Tax=Pullulanibacillus camelliae TaxID=1707096 RepID=A0A8J2YFH5_9BACL|nr:NADP-dependent oxidoreductase [Pullulanibacillus camelliae]GGE29073.1 oxidoreductase [Pullulanibacillus camelliae]
MKAIVINAYGDRSQLKEREFPTPMPKENEVLIEIYATSVNPIDWKLREGYLKEHLPLPFPIILGWDAAGVVKKVGSKVKKFAEGDRVFARPATTERGTYAEYIAVDEGLVADMPKNISFIEAAAVPLAGLTAWQCLVDFAEIKKGDQVLIHAGAGGVGSMAIQIAKAKGAKVIATGSANNQDTIKKLGADHMVNYKTTKLTDVLSDMDIVLDTIGGEVEEESFKVLKPGGVLVSIVQPPSQEKAKEKDIKAGLVLLQPDGDQLAQLAEMMKDEKLKPLVGEVLPFSEEGVKKAHEISESHHAKGKIVIEVKKEE